MDIPNKALNKSGDIFQDLNFDMPHLNKSS
jgi:hypothetical protein